MSRRKETDYYEEIANELRDEIGSSLGQSYTVKALIGEVSSALRTLIVDGYNAGNALRDYADSSHRLHLDIAILIENKQNGKFELVIFEVKRTDKMGLTQLSQLIGYCLVSKTKFGILINIDNPISRDFSVILNGDHDLTSIERKIDNQVLKHEFGVMIWDSATKRVNYTQAGKIGTIPQLISLIKTEIDR